MTDDDVRGLLRELRDEPVPPDSLVRVRQAVQERRRRKSPMAWLALIAAAAAAMVIAAVLLRPVSPPSAPPVARTKPALSPAPVATQPALTKPAQPFTIARKAVTKRPRIRPAAAAVSSDSLVVRIETPDPDVVILLVGD